MTFRKNLIKYIFFKAYPPYYGADVGAYYYNPMMSSMASQYGAHSTMMRNPYENPHMLSTSPHMGYPYDYKTPSYPFGQQQPLQVSTPVKGTVNDISGGVKKQGSPGCNLFVFYVPNHWSKRNNRINIVIKSYLL